MSKKAKITLISIIGIFIVFALPGFVFLASVKGDFTHYLKEKYPDQTFKVENTKINIIYGNFFTNVTCLNDGTSFPISRGFKTKDIRENYIEYKSLNQYNQKLKELFEGSNIERYIKNITGGGKLPYKDNGIYEYISVQLTDDSQHITIVKKILNILKENQISAPAIRFMYENNKHVYQIRLSSDEYDLPENEIEAKIEIIK